MWNFILRNSYNVQEALKIITLINQHLLERIFTLFAHISIKYFNVLPCVEILIQDSLLHICLKTFFFSLISILKLLLLLILFILTSIILVVIIVIITANSCCCCFPNISVLRVSALLISPTWFLYDYYVLFSFMIIFSRLYITMNIIAQLKPQMENG